ncbi:MAG: CCA tRNA nucleotidyltransferase [Pseudanabaenaceae cyanobacterium bins.68]|nr:CCA tRNA nucleotidyltransferase [Pseudanabaenaceae cyanobacterium bins.68]
MTNFLDLQPQELPEPTYLVGGWVRNLLMTYHHLPFCAKSKLDLDLVTANFAVEMGADLARKHGAGYVVLDRDRQIARLVFADATVDFARQVGDNILTDLSKRDFCMNAIAMPCNHFATLTQPLQTADLERLIDPHGGQADLWQRQVRMVAPENLQADPLRIVRGYRQAAQLGFELEKYTRLTSTKLACSLGSVAAERVTAELFYLLEMPGGRDWLIKAVQDQILATWLPNNLRVERLNQVDRAIAWLKDRYQSLSTYFAASLAGDRSIAANTRLIALVDSRPTRLELSKVEQKFGIILTRSLQQLKTLLHSHTILEQYDLFQASGNSLPAVVAIALAEGISPEQLCPWLEQWLDPNHPIAHPLTLVSGDQIKQALNLAPSPKIGQLLTKIRLAQIQGIITDAAEAIAYATNLLAQEHCP